MFWLNDDDSNIASMSITLCVFQLCSGWLNEEALKNILAILVTPDTSHSSSEWLKLTASENMDRIVVTFETDQFPMG